MPASSDARLVAQRANILRFLADPLIDARMRHFKYAVQTITDRKAPKLRLGPSDLVPGFLGVFTETRIRQRASICHYESFIFWEELHEEFNQLYHCPTAASVPVLDYFVQDRATKESLALADSTWRDDKQAWLVRVVFLGDPTAVGPIVNDPMGTGREPNCKLETCAPESVGFYQKFDRRTQKWLVRSSIFCITSLRSIDPDVECLAAYESAGVASGNFWKNSSAHIAGHFCDRCYSKMDTPVNPIYLCSADGWECSTGRHKDCFAHGNHLYLAVDWYCERHSANRPLPADDLLDLTFSTTPPRPSTPRMSTRVPLDDFDYSTCSSSSLPTFRPKSHQCGPRTTVTDRASTPVPMDDLDNPACSSSSVPPKSHQCGPPKTVTDRASTPVPMDDLDNPTCSSSSVPPKSHQCEPRTTVTDGASTPVPLDDLDNPTCSSSSVPPKSHQCEPRAAVTDRASTPVPLDDLDNPACSSSSVPPKSHQCEPRTTVTDRASTPVPLDDLGLSSRTSASDSDCFVDPIGPEYYDTRSSGTDGSQSDFDAGVDNISKMRERTHKNRALSSKMETSRCYSDSSSDPDSSDESDSEDSGKSDSCPAAPVPKPAPFQITVRSAAAQRQLVGVLPPLDRTVRERLVAALQKSGQRKAECGNRRKRKSDDPGKQIDILQLRYAEVRACCATEPKIFDLARTNPSLFLRAPPPFMSIEQFQFAQLEFGFERGSGRTALASFVEGLILSALQPDGKPASWNWHGVPVCQSCYAACIGVSRPTMIRCRDRALRPNSEPTSRKKRSLRARAKQSVRDCTLVKLAADHIEEMRRTGRLLIQHDPQGKGGNIDKPDSTSVFTLTHCSKFQFYEQFYSDWYFHQPPQRRVPCYSTFDRALRLLHKKEDGPHVRFMFNKAKGMAICDTCVECQANMAATKKRKGDQQGALRKLHEHYDEVIEQRDFSDNKKRTALTHPHLLWCVLMDAMDSSKTELPCYQQLSKATESGKRLGVRWTGNFVFGGPKPIVAVANFEDIAKGGNMSCANFERVLDIQFEAMDTDAHPMLKNHYPTPEIDSQSMPVAPSRTKREREAVQKINAEEASFDDWARVHPANIRSLDWIRSCVNGPKEAAADWAPSTSFPSESIHPAWLQPRPKFLWPEGVHLQFDNAAGDFKNSTFFRFVGMFVALGTFLYVTLGTMTVGHTHDIVDQLFSVWSRSLDINDCVTYAEMAFLFRQKYHSKIYAIKEIIESDRKIGGVPEATVSQRVVELARDLGALPEIVLLQFSIDAERWMYVPVADKDRRVSETFEWRSLDQKYGKLEGTRDYHQFYIVKEAAQDRSLGDEVVLYSRHLADTEHTPPEVTHHYKRVRFGPWTNRTRLFLISDVQHLIDPQHRHHRNPMQLPPLKIALDSICRTLDAEERLGRIDELQRKEWDEWMERFDAMARRTAERCTGCATLIDQIGAYGPLHRPSATATPTEREDYNKKKTDKDKKRQELQVHLNDPGLVAQHSLFTNGTYWAKWIERTKNVIIPHYRRRGLLRERIDSGTQSGDSGRTPHPSRPVQNARDNVHIVPVRVDANWIKDKGPPEKGHYIVCRSTDIYDPFWIGYIPKEQEEKELVQQYAAALQTARERLEGRAVDLNNEEKAELEDVINRQSNETFVRLQGSSPPAANAAANASTGAEVVGNVEDAIMDHTSTAAAEDLNAGRTAQCRKRPREPALEAEEETEEQTERHPPAPEPAAACSALENRPCSASSGRARRLHAVIASARIELASQSRAAGGSSARISTVEMDEDDVPLALIGEFHQNQRQVEAAAESTRRRSNGRNKSALVSAPARSSQVVVASAATAPFVRASNTTVSAPAAAAVCVPSIQSSRKKIRQADAIAATPVAASISTPTESSFPAAAAAASAKSRNVGPRTQSNRSSLEDLRPLDLVLWFDYDFNDCAKFRLNDRDMWEHFVLGQQYIYESKNDNVYFKLPADETTPLDQKQRDNYLWSIAKLSHANRQFSRLPLRVLNRWSQVRFWPVTDKNDVKRYGIDVRPESMVLWGPSEKIFTAGGRLLKNIFDKLVEDRAETIDLQQGTAIDYAADNGEK